MHNIELVQYFKVVVITHIVRILNHKMKKSELKLKSYESILLLLMKCRPLNLIFDIFNNEKTERFLKPSRKHKRSMDLFVQKIYKLFIKQKKQNYSKMYILMYVPQVCIFSWIYGKKEIWSFNTHSKVKTFNFSYDTNLAQF